MIFSHSLFVGIVCLLVTQLSFASSDKLLEQQRTQFQKANAALQKQQLRQFNQIKQQLDGYPLQSYLQYLYMKSHLNDFSDSSIHHFIEQHQHVFYGEILRRHWLDKLAKNKDWQRYLKYYQAPQAASRQCTRLTALIKTKQLQNAEQAMRQLWLTPKSQHKNCDVGFKFFKQQNKISEQLYWQRIELAVKAKQFSLANYLAKSTQHPDTTKKWIARWQQMHNQPEQQLKRLPMARKPQHWPDFMDYQKLEKDLIAMGLKRLARKFTDKAFSQWQRLKTAHIFSLVQRQTIQADIAQRAALNRQDKTLTFYGNLPNQHWRARAALWQQDWPAIQQAIFSLDDTEQQSPRWQYWLARSHAALGHQHDADILYHRLMLERDYYGFLAADKLGKPYHFNEQTLNIDQPKLAQFRQRADIQQLYEFYSLGLHQQARRQAYFLRQSLPEYELEMLATLSHQWGWHNQAIALLGKAKSWNDLDIRFPVVYAEQMERASKSTDLDTSWLLGVARQESAFNPKARSHVGARGLMQLMPQTARATAKKHRIRLKNLSELATPSKNIQLGSAYLKQVYNEHQKNPVLATASYNAGPHRVTRWLPKTKLPADIWIENIPFNETRKYTATVMSYAAIFDFQRKKDITPISKRMPAILPIDPLK